MVGEKKFGIISDQTTIRIKEGKEERKSNTYVESIIFGDEDFHEKLYRVRERKTFFSFFLRHVWGWVNGWPGMQPR